MLREQAEHMALQRPHHCTAMPVRRSSTTSRQRLSGHGRADHRRHRHARAQAAQHPGREDRQERGPSECGRILQTLKRPRYCKLEIYNLHAVHSGASLTMRWCPRAIGYPRNGDHLVLEKGPTANYISLRWMTNITFS